MLLAVNMNFVAFSYYLNDMHGQVFVFFILTVAGAESAIGLAILVLLFRNKSNINVDELNTLKARKTMSQTLSASTLLAVPLAPLVVAVIAGVFGTTFGGNLIGRRLSHTVTILGVFIAFVLSAMTLKSVAIDGARFNQTIYEWMVVGGLKMEVGFLVDGLTAMMMCVVTFVSLMVHIYTIGYMEEDEGYNRFFGYISLFTFSMLMLVMSNNFLQLFFGWEAVGLVSYLLIGFWYTSRPRSSQHEGLPGQPGRRLRLHPGHRPDRGLRRVPQLRRGVRQGLASSPSWLPRHQLDADHRHLHLPVHRRHGQERAVPLHVVAAGLDGRPDARSPR
jgi:hypothetical protein